MRDIPSVNTYTGGPLVLNVKVQCLSFDSVQPMRSFLMERGMTQSAFPYDFNFSSVGLKPAFEYMTQLFVFDDLSMIILNGFNKAAENVSGLFCRVISRTLGRANHAR